MGHVNVAYANSVTVHDGCHATTRYFTNVEGAYCRVSVSLCLAEAICLFRFWILYCST